MDTNRLYAFVRILTAVLMSLLCSSSQAQNDNCAGAIPILLPNAGYGYGTVSSATTNFSSLSMQRGESLAPANNEAGQNQQSAWYTFTLPTPRYITLSLLQPGSSINQGDVGLAVYKTGNCLPVPVDLSTQLFPLTGFGSVSASCVGPGTYLVQVVGKSSANGPVFLQLQASATGAVYDAAADAADLGLASPLPSAVLYPVDCQSLESFFEVCGSLANASQYTKSSWQVFSTPDVFSSLLLQLSVPSLPAGQKIGLRVFDGDLRWAAGNIVVLCDSLLTDANGTAARLFACNSLRPNRVYSVELFFHQDFNAPVEVSVRTDSVPVQKSFQAVCSGNSYTLPWGAVAMANGQYADTLRTSGGCDSLVRNITVQFDTARKVTDTIIYLCPVLNYILPWGQVVNAPGVYSKAWNYVSGCDSASYTVRLLPPPVPVQNQSINACPGSAYTLPWGQTVSTPGRYRDTLRNSGGCDSLIRIIDLSFTNNSDIRFMQDSTCSNNYVLPWGGIASSSGIYYDTLRRTNGCDSIVVMLSLTIKGTILQQDSVSLCYGTSYTLPWGTMVDTSGIYSDTIRYTGKLTCDSLVRQVNLLYGQPIERQVQQGFLCQGGSFTLPWGTVVNSPGLYRDTVKTAGGCDSLIQAVNLSLLATIISDTSVLLCAGGMYPLPWGGLADSDSIYTYSIVGVLGCDSLRQTISVHILRSNTDTMHASLCQGQNLTLPWGEVADTAGTYRDTLRYANGCDSLLRVVQVSVTTLQTEDTPVMLCSGGSFILPWGQVANATGIYADTLRSSGGCDSLARRFTVSIGTLSIDHRDISSCTASYILPWGQEVNTPGLYKDTLRAAAGCDSLVREIALTLVAPQTISTDTSICQGQTLRLPGGLVAGNTGTYRDTIYGRGGCDSIVNIIHLTVLSVRKDTTTAFFCNGNTYTLPWGAIASRSGVYSDTTRGIYGCDSLVHTVLLLLSTVVKTDSVSICQGASYTLPWGGTVQAGGTYADTLRYTNGCASSIHIVKVNQLSTTLQNSTATICNGASYTLPWGRTVSTPGIYSDTMHYAGGCDSLVRQVSVSQSQPLLRQIDTSLCNGQAYLLPGGLLTTSSGTYRDTIHSMTGCDSLIYITRLTIATTTSRNTIGFLCQGQAYALPWGQLVSTPGIYSDTLYTVKGCDSLVRSVNVVKDSLSTSVAKSNDVNCLLLTAQLRASGGIRYLWSPPGDLDNPQVFNPVASPAQTTTYQVQITKANGCETTDTITVFAVTAYLDNAFLVPNAFTPDGDGKNDCFGIRHWGAVSNLHFSIFNRWGQMVFQTTDPKKCWDGTFKGALLPTASFVYFIEANTPCGPVVRKGTVTLVR